MAFNFITLTILSLKQTSSIFPVYIVRNLKTIGIMKKESNNKDELKKNESAIKEQAINKKETDGRDINQQVKDKREKHQPRDNA